MMRSSVDFPQPDGPTKTTKSPSSTARSMPVRTSVRPNFLVMPTSSSAVTDAADATSFNGTRGNSANQIFREQQVQHHNWRDAQRKRGEPRVPIRDVLADELLCS